MNITCPKCNFSRTVDPAKIPDRQVKVNCPKCGESFAFDKAAQPDSSLPERKPASEQEQSAPKKSAQPLAAGHDPGRRIICHACGTVQPPAGQCAHCGATIFTTSSPVQSCHYAGFWIRAGAYLLDFLLLWSVEYVLSLLIGLTVGLLGLSVAGDPSIDVVIWLFGAALSISYAVFFTGYCGQTPGKMALRIKVIRTDGSPVSYGRAVLREVLGKFISGILLGIGYLMVAFDSQKQGLHDKIADTYVIRL